MKTSTSAPSHKFLSPGPRQSSRGWHVARAGSIKQQYNPLLRDANPGAFTRPWWQEFIGKGTKLVFWAIIFTSLFIKESTLESSEGFSKAITNRCCPGVQGPPGPNGSNGDPGLPGDPGPQGPMGIQGNAGANAITIFCTPPAGIAIAQGRIPLGIGSGSSANYTYTSTATSITLTLMNILDNNATVVATAEGTGGTPVTVTILRGLTTVTLTVTDATTGLPFAAGFINFVAMECFTPI